MTGSGNVPKMKPGLVLRYTPQESHCREGVAFVGEDGVARDTYWRPTGDSESYALRGDDLDMAEVLFDVEDYVALDRYSASSRTDWLAHHPDDRGRITSQHGLQEALFVRRGSKPHLATQIDNAREAVVRAEAAVESAKNTLDRRQGELEVLEQGAPREDSER